MFNILNNWKLYLLSFALICSLSLNTIQRFKILSLEKAVLEWQGKAVALQIGIDYANQMRADLERKLRLRETEAAKAQAESKKRMDEILKANVQGDVNDWLLSQALGFQWDNNIP